MKFNFLRKKSNLDEFQEQKLVHIERDSFWILYWMLVIEMVLQVMIGKEPMAVAGEWVCFMAISVIIIVRCLRNGIWDRRVRANRKSNLRVSIVAAVIVAFLVSALSYCLGRGRIGLKDAAVEAACSGVITLVITYLIISILAFVYKKRLGALEGEGEE